MRSPGFGPGLTAWKADVLNQARLRPLGVILHCTSKLVFISSWSLAIFSSSFLKCLNGTMVSIFLLGVHRMINVDAVIFDFIGTLTKIENYSLKESKDAMFKSLVTDGFTLERESFMKAYETAHQKYRDIRYKQLVEVNNAFWISEALNALNYQATPEDMKVKNARIAFFRNYLTALTLRRSARVVLQKLADNYKTGLISNFTHAPVIYAGLRKLEMNSYFNEVLVSDAIGWRKPSPVIFKKAIHELHVNAERTAFVGDTPLEDIFGAKNAGIRSVFIPSQFNTTDDMQNADFQPDYYIEKLEDLLEIFKI
jgi:putative hydrolase of the HAD superfamily